MKIACLNSKLFFLTGHLKIYFILILFTYLFLVALGLHCCVWTFSSCVERGLLFVAVHVLLIAVASFVAERGL